MGQKLSTLFKKRPTLDVASVASYDTKNDTALMESEDANQENKDTNQENKEANDENKDSNQQN